MKFDLFYGFLVQEGRTANLADLAREPADDLAEYIDVLVGLLLVVVTFGAF